MILVIAIIFLWRHHPLSLFTSAALAHVDPAQGILNLLVYLDISASVS
jgi:hypothetical protein